MNRILQLNPWQAAAEAKKLFGVVERTTGVVPNVIRVLGNAPAALNGFLSLQQALAVGVLSASLREQIALAVSEVNGCAYCLSAHSRAAKLAGLTSSEISAARFATGCDNKSGAVLDLVWAIVLAKGQIDDLDIQAARKAGLSDEEIVEVMANIALTILTNYVNHVAGTEIDFPEVIPGVLSDDALNTSFAPGSAPQPVFSDV